MIGFFIFVGLVYLGFKYKLLDKSVSVIWKILTYFGDKFFFVQNAFKEHREGVQRIKSYNLSLKRRIKLNDEV